MINFLFGLSVGILLTGGAVLYSGYKQTKKNKCIVVDIYSDEE